MTGKGAALSYDFSGGDSYVAVTLTLPTPLTATAIGYAAKAAGVRMVLRVVDTSGQTLQYQAQRTSRELLTAWALGLPMEIHYDIRDDGTDPTTAEHNLGLATSVTVSESAGPVFVKFPNPSTGTPGCGCVAAGGDAVALAPVTAALALLVSAARRRRTTGRGAC